jgi:hypothetical protein
MTEARKPARIHSTMPAPRKTYAQLTPAQKQSATAAKAKWRKAHREQHTAHVLASKARQTPRTFPPDSRRQRMMCAAAQQLGYTIVGRSSLLNPRFTWIDRHGRRHKESLTMPSTALAAAIRHAQRVGIEWT